MSATYTEVEFDEGEEFNLPLRFEREAVARRFAELQDDLLSDYVEATGATNMSARLKHAANEAAGLAWTTEFPLLVFPGLFDEMARRERVRNLRQQRIIARTENLLEAVV
jgi:hypothetical protein